MANAYPTPANSAHTDANQQFSIIGVVGTLGTSDTAGTAFTVPFSADAATGAMFNKIIGTVATQNSTTPVEIGTPLNVQGTTGAAVWGTIVSASGAGTKQYVSRVSIVVTAGTVDVAVTNQGIGGSTGAGVLERGQFPAGGGITNVYTPVMASGTNGTIAYWLGGAGTVSINVNYWQGV